MAIKLIHGNSLEELKTLEDNSVDSIVTDPPYEIGFMSKKWDSSGIAFNEELWTECLRVLKPGGHLLAFGATRSYHRMTVAIEDSGFEIRDCIMWLYGSGFPKSHNIGKAIDKIEGNTREVVDNPYSNRRPNGNKWVNTISTSVDTKTKGNTQWEGWGTALKPAVEPVVMARKPFKGTVADNVLEHGTGAINIDECRISHNDPVVKTNRQKNTGITWNEANSGLRKNPTDIASADPNGRWPANVILDEEAGAILDEQSGERKSSPFKHKLKTNTIYGSYNFDETNGGYDDNGGASRFFYKPEPDTDDLYPNVEPVVMARKPFKGTVADNVLEHGTGAINIDECRIGTEGGTTRSGQFPVGESGWRTGHSVLPTNEGRWPANVILDEEAGAILDEQSGISKPSKGRTGKKGGKSIHDGGWKKDVMGTWPADNGGGASRFFYCPKANKTDRNEGCDEFEEKTTKGAIGLSTVGRKPTGDDPQENRQVKNNHPTVKPTDLLAYLIRLVTPKGGVVLDPFMGSGSCGKAAIREGMSYIGIELEREYYEIAQARIKHEQDKHKNPFDKFAGNPDEENK